MPNFFEKLLLFLGFFVIIVSYGFIHAVIAREGLFSWEALQTIFLWLILIVLIVMTAVNENMREEIALIIRNQLDELKLLRKDLRYRR